MAYFANGTDGSVFDEQCSKCKYGDKPCPIAATQILHGYESCNNKQARQILDELVKDDGTCTMWKTFRQDFEINPNQLDLFP
jgi:hypothetical protein